MKPTAAIVILLVAFGTTAALAQAPRDHHGVQNVVVIFQENRTPDNLFHDPNLISAGADIASSGLNSLGQTIQLTSVPLASNYDLSHAHSAFLAMYDNGLMNGADKVKVNCYQGAQNCPPPNAPFTYVNPSDVRPYFQMAEQIAGDFRRKSASTASRKIDRRNKCRCLTSDPLRFLATPFSHT